VIAKVYLIEYNEMIFYGNSTLFDTVSKENKKRRKIFVIFSSRESSSFKE
jgi:hypothetical protein